VGGTDRTKQEQDHEDSWREEVTDEQHRQGIENVDCRYNHRRSDRARSDEMCKKKKDNPFADRDPVEKAQ